jgi:hypothetical protein
LEVALSSEIGRAAPKRARVRRARIKPEAHSYINVKTCSIEIISAAVEKPKRKTNNRHMSIAPSSQLDFPSATTLVMMWTMAVSNALSHTYTVHPYQIYIIPCVYHEYKSRQGVVKTYDRLEGVEKERKRFIEYPT